jgi:hypothetical protein
MTPARDRLARILMILLGVASVGAFVNAAGAFGAVAPDRVTIEVWRMFAFLVFAGLFALLGMFPRHMTGVWELVFLHKAGVAAFLAFVVEPTLGSSASLGEAGAIPVDTVLAVTTLVSYLLTRGWRAWLTRGDAQ